MWKLRSGALRSNLAKIELRQTMKEAPLDPTQVTRAKLISRIALAQKQADSAKKNAKLAKLVFRQARKKLKESKRTAK